MIPSETVTTVPDNSDVDDTHVEHLNRDRYSITFHW